MFLGEGESPRLLARESWASGRSGWAHPSSKSAVTAPFRPVAQGAALHREARSRRPSVRNGSPYLERHGGTQLRDSPAHPASGAAPAGGCTETLETLEDSGPAPHDRRRGRGPGRAGSRSVGSPGSAPRLASREGVVPLPPAAPGLTARTTQAQTTLPRGLRGWDVAPGGCGGGSLDCSAPRTSSSSGSGTAWRPPRPVGLAAAHAQVQTTVHPNNHPSPLCDPSSIWRFLSASCAGARWGCVDKKRPLSLIGCSHANPTLSG